MSTGVDSVAATAAALVGTLFNNLKETDAEIRAARNLADS